jgi:hypothetical protein
LGIGGNAGDGIGMLLRVTLSGIRVPEFGEALP